MAAKDNVLLSKLYPKIETKTKTNLTKLKQVIAKFIEVRGPQLYDIGPFDRIPFGGDDIENFFKALGITEREITEILSHTYYYPVANFNPRAAKDEFTVTVLTIIRYLYLKKMTKETELFMIYLAFSGKFYPSIHYGSYKVVPPSEYRHVMEYVINNRLSNKFDIKREGSVFGAIKSICNTWLETYDDKLKRYEDEDVVYLIQQLHNRIKSFMINIAEVYYEVYDNKNIYMTYDSDNLSDDDYHVADNDSLLIERCVEKTMNNLNNASIDYRICKMASDSNVKTDEVKGIMELVLNDTENIIEVKELIRLIVTEYMVNSKSKDIRDIDFISKSITPKPNSKNPNIIRQREIIEGWLDDKSPAYRKRKSREATKSSYHKSVMTYIVLLIHNANK